jgi:hypothetical protein
VWVLHAGDWAAVGQLLASQGMGGYYDIILTAETIYNEDSQQRLLDCIKQVGPLRCMPAACVCAAQAVATLPSCYASPAVESLCLFRCL